MRAKPNSILQATFNGTDYTIDLSRLTQVNKRTGFTRAIRRHPIKSMLDDFAGGMDVFPAYWPKVAEQKSSFATVQLDANSQVYKEVEQMVGLPSNSQRKIVDITLVLNIYEWKMYHMSVSYTHLTLPTKA